ncbi:MAG TPA: hypothetical protein VLX92_06520 [Kofleriaceae bacterium]|nr:hypothetical protein [Kofleriaceae bacterium]
MVACGGSSDSPPGPLARHFDDMYIAAIPIDQKQSVVQSQQDYSVAKMEQAKAEADYNDATTQLQIARNDAQAAHLNVSSAVSSKKSADASGDQNRINDAIKNLHTAEDMAKAADARVRYIDTYRNFLHRYLRYTQENTYYREAQFEGAKAQLAKQNNIQPKGVSYDAFPGQTEERQHRTQAAKERAEHDKQATLGKRDEWLKIQHQADIEAGKPSNFPDPMAPKVAGPEPAAASSM